MDFQCEHSEKEGLAKAMISSEGDLLMHLSISTFAGRSFPAVAVGAAPHIAAGVLGIDRAKKRNGSTVLIGFMFVGSGGFRH